MNRPSPWSRLSSLPLLFSLTLAAGPPGYVATGVQPGVVSSGGRTANTVTIAVK